VPTGPFLPIDKPGRQRRLDRDRFDELPLAKPMRVIDPAAIEAARRDYCERCGTRAGPFEVHHVKSRGAGGADADPNLINLCSGPRVNCHDLAHRGRIPRAELLALIARRRATPPPPPPRPRPAAPG
jgi:hypothetical protein